MTILASQLKRDRARRDAARDLFETRLTQIRSDLDARSIGGRFIDKATEEARNALDETVAIANDNKAVILGAAAVLTLWFLRNPILSRAQALFATIFQRSEGDNAPQEQEAGPPLSQSALPNGEQIREPQTN